MTSSGSESAQSTSITQQLTVHVRDLDQLPKALNLLESLSANAKISAEVLDWREALPSSIILR